MNRQRLTALLTATAVLAGVFGILNGAMPQMMSRTWADGAPAAVHAAKLMVKVPTVTKKGKGRTVKVVTTHGRTWT